MRIAFDAKRYFNNQTGLGNFSRELVHAIAVAFPEHEYFLLHNENAKPLKELKNLQVFSPRRKGLFWRSYGIVKDLKHLKIDVYHGLSNEIPFGIKGSGIKSVVTIHDVIFKRFPGFYPSFDRWIYDWKTKYALKHANNIVATSHATALDIATFYGKKEEDSTVIYQPVQSEFYEKNYSNSGEQMPYFIYVSGFSDRKNHATLVEAFSHIQNTCDWNLLFAGASGNTLDAVRKFIDHEKLGKRITVLTDLKIHDLVHLMRGASGFVYPSLYEGFGIPLAEAAVCGLPIAASDIPVFREIAGDAAFYFHPNRAREIADGMLKLTSKEHTLPILAKQGEILKKIEPGFIAKQYMDLYCS